MGCGGALARATTSASALGQLHGAAAQPDGPIGYQTFDAITLRAVAAEAGSQSGVTASGAA